METWGSTESNNIANYFVSSGSCLPFELPCAIREEHVDHCSCSQYYICIDSHEIASRRCPDGHEWLGPNRGCENRTSARQVCDPYQPWTRCNRKGRAYNRCNIVHTTRPHTQRPSKPPNGTPRDIEDTLHVNRAVVLGVAFGILLLSAFAMFCVMYLTRRKRYRCCTKTPFKSNYNSTQYLDNSNCYTPRTNLISCNKNQNARPHLQVFGTPRTPNMRTSIYNYTSFVGHKETYTDYARDVSMAAVNVQPKIAEQLFQPKSLEAANECDSERWVLKKQLYKHHLLRLVSDKHPNTARPIRKNPFCNMNETLKEDVPQINVTNCQPNISDNKQEVEEPKATDESLSEEKLMKILEQKGSPDQDNSHL